MVKATVSISKHPTCAGVRQDGARCAAPALTSSPYCYSHAPDRAGERAEARRRGGENRGNAARLRALVPPRLVPVFGKLESALEDVLAGRLEARQATAAAALARAMVSVLSAGELEDRVRQLERERGER